MKVFFLPFFIFLISFSVQSQENIEKDNEPALVLGTTHEINSEVLNEKRPYKIYLPDSYNDQNFTPKAYPVLYLIAGDDLLAKAVTRQMSRNGVNQIPELILVGIPVSDFIKYHSLLTPTQSNMLPDGRSIPGMLDDTGRANEFLSFMEQELIPQIESTYRTKDFRIISGGSIAGLFSLHAFIKGEDPFQAYLAIDPALWWDEEELVKRLENRTVDKEDLEGQVYIAMASRLREGSSRESMNDPMQRFAEQLDSPEGKGVHFRLQDFPEEQHGSVAPLAFYHGLKHIFTGYESVPDQFAERPESIIPHYENVSQRLGVEFLPPESLLNQMGNWLLSDAMASGQRDSEKLGKAVEILEISSQLYPDSLPTQLALADAYAASGKREKAVEEYQELLKEDPQNEAVKQRLERLKQ